MKVFIDRNYNISKIIDKQAFIQGDDNFDKLYVYMEENQVINDRVLPVFLFEKEDSSLVGFITHDNSFETNVSGTAYTVFERTLTSDILDCNGLLKITIKFQFFDAESNLIKERNIQTSNYVSQATSVSSDILIIDPDNVENIIKSLMKSMQELNFRLDAFGRITFQVVEELPLEANSNIIYLMKQATPSDNNYYEEYMFINGKWEHLGDTDVNLTNINVVAKTLSEDEEAYVKKVVINGVDSFEFGIPRGQRGLQGIQGVQGVKGPKGDKGDKGETGADGVQTIINGMFAMGLDAEGNLYVYSNDFDTTPSFEYDAETGNLYYVYDDSNAVNNIANGDDFAYGN